MKNLQLSIENEELVIRINLLEEHGLSGSQRSTIIASSGGNLRLCNPDGSYREERINLTVSKKAPLGEY
jgi:hypothetical protein